MWLALSKSPCLSDSSSHRPLIILLLYMLWIVCCRVIKHPTIRRNWKVYLGSFTLMILGLGRNFHLFLCNYTTKQILLGSCLNFILSIWYHMMRKDAKMCLRTTVMKVTWNTAFLPMNLNECQNTPDTKRFFESNLSCDIEKLYITY